MEPKPKKCSLCGCEQTPKNSYIAPSGKYFAARCRVCSKKAYHQPSDDYLPNLLGYTEMPCIYIRWLDSKQKFYVGRTKNLLKRYLVSRLTEVIYFEEFKTIDLAAVREREIIEDFVLVNLPLANISTRNGRYLTSTLADRHVYRYAGSNQFGL